MCLAILCVILETHWGAKERKLLRSFLHDFFFLVVPIDLRSQMTMVEKLFCEPWLKCQAEVQGCKQGIFQCAFPKVLYTVTFSCVPTKSITQNHCCSLLLLLLCVFSFIQDAILFTNDFVQFACTLNAASGSTPLGKWFLQLCFEVLWFVIFWGLSFVFKLVLTLKDLTVGHIMTESPYCLRKWDNLRKQTFVSCFVGWKFVQVIT